ncbi:MAG: tRNA (adenosine(37)-N6)-threonylcarbamoyltransferase complex ATPase subunit type 1 TsaE [Planctomycetes bacterium]|nr:tRNA (adenosine(37)-N6)-threonylcarbamoyltransferase complex ATPase subunit type 1 TsaE [Planctomycetota bacterium]
MSLPVDERAGNLWSWTASDEAATEHFGAALARALEPGTVVSLTGELGAGKTRLVQAVSTALGVPRAEVTSPTFVLLQEYRSQPPLYHFDTYRLRDVDEFLALGADELLWSTGVCFVEWGERVADVLPADRLQIELETLAPTARLLQVSWSGPRAERVAATLRRALDLSFDCDG